MPATSSPHLGGGYEMTNKLIAGILAALVSAAVQARWTKVAETNDTIYYIDFKTIRKTPSGYRVWELKDYKKSNTGGWSTKTLYEYNCKEEQYRHLDATYYSSHMGGEVFSIQKVSNQGGCTFLQIRLLSTT
jgi:hypothetical protein